MEKDEGEEVMLCRVRMVGGGMELGSVGQDTLVYRTFAFRIKGGRIWIVPGLYMYI